ncbi:Amino-acid acetyltransferase, mitochondrial [Coemansia sp. RSA 1200]|nr:Amino-acid acetyltransferase, mitochondrial [Coemansia sp. RSA 1200]
MIIPKLYCSSSKRAACVARRVASDRGATVLDTRAIGGRNSHHLALPLLQMQQRRLLTSGQPSERKEDTQQQHHQAVDMQGRNLRERELILNVLSTVPSPREARKFLNSVYGSETMRSQRAFEEQQARLAAEQQQQAENPTQREDRACRRELVAGKIHQRHTQATRSVRAEEKDPVLPRRLTALVFVDGLAGTDHQACKRVGKQLAQMQRIGVSPIVLLVANTNSTGGGAPAVRGSKYREIIHTAHALADAIEQEGGKARPVNDAVFYTSPYVRGQLSVDPELLGSALAQYLIPIVTPLVADSSLHVNVLDTNQAAPAMTRALAVSALPRDGVADAGGSPPMPGSGGQFSLLLARLVLLSSRVDGLCANDGSFHRFVNLEEDYTSIEQQCRDRATLQLMRTCLAILPPTTAGIVASVHSDPSLVLKGLISERPVGEPVPRRGAAGTASLQSSRDSSSKAAQQQQRRLSVPDYKPIAEYPFVKIGEEEKGAAVPAALPKSTRPGRFTLLRHGFRIQRHTSVNTCSQTRLRELLEASFGRQLDSERYFERLRALESQGGIEIIIAGDYQGAVVVTYEDISKQADGTTGLRRHLPYLDKFAVLPSVQGTGMADILWAQLRRACPSCMWRSRNDNGVNKWYFDRSHGHARSAPAAAADGATRWVFFWYQNQNQNQNQAADSARFSALSIDEVQAGIRAAQSIPPSFA